MLFCMLAWPQFGHGQDADVGVSVADERDRAVSLARDGRFDDALALIATLRELAPENVGLLYDETVIFGWAGQDARVTENASLIDRHAAPEYVLGAIAKAFRNQQDFESARQWYAVMLETNPALLDARIGLVMTLADAGDIEAAWQVLAETPTDQQDAVQVTLAKAYIHELQGRYMDALARYQEALVIEPDNRAALRGKALVLRMALLPRQALDIGRAHPGLLSDEEMFALEADVVALQIRQGASSTYPVPRRFEGTDRAIAYLDELLEKPGIDPGTRRRLQFDRIVALSDRLRMTEAVMAYEAMQVAPEHTPTYVLVSVGQAYLYERKPAMASRYLEMAVAREPGSIDYKFRLFFAYADLQRHGRALELAESLLADLPPTNPVPGSDLAKGSDAYLRAAILVGLGKAFADQLADSQAHFEALLAELPHNTDFRQELANVYRWRGWLDRSLAEYAQVLAVEPDLLSARIGNAHAQLDAAHFERVDAELDSLARLYGDEPAVKSLGKRWQTHNRWEVLIDGQTGESTGSTFGQDQYEIDVNLYSQPIAYRLRAFLSAHEAYAEFPEGFVRRERYGAGLEYRHRRLLLSGSVTDAKDGDAVGFRGRLAYRASDFWTLSTRVETNSNASPLRAEPEGVTGDLVGLDARYARHESAAIWASATQLSISDGNTLNSFMLGAERRLFNGADYKLALLGEAYYGTSEFDDAIYYSPRESVSWMAGLRNEWAMYRRYDLALIHRLTGKAGEHDQGSFGSNRIWSAEYEFSLQISPRLSARIGVLRTRNVYDATREYGTFLLAGISGRL